LNLNALPIEAVFVEAKKKSEVGSAPLLVVLHGRGDSPDGFLWMPETLALPQLSYLLLQAPDDYYGGYSWYAMAPDQLPGILRSRELLAQVFAEVFKQGYRPENTLLFGFSQGCLMTLEYGGRALPKLRGYIGVSGYAYDADALAAESKPELKLADWLVTHGTRDDVLPIARTREQIHFLNQSGFQIEYQEYEKVHTIDEAEELPKIREFIAARI
jgi:phospholipase/carboxylesterase